MAVQYGLKIQALLDDKSNPISKQLSKEINDLTAKGLNVVNVAVKLDDKGTLSGFTTQAKGAFNELTTVTGKYGADIREYLTTPLSEASNEMDKTFVVSEKMADGFRVVGREVDTTTRISENYARNQSKLSTELKKNSDFVSLNGKNYEVLWKATEKATEKQNYFTKSMMQSIKSAAQYALSIGLIYKALGELSKGIDYIRELDKEMRNIQIVAGYTDETIKNLSVGYNSLAREMGATTLEVASGSLEWVRQGKTIEETQELLQSTLMLSKLGAINSASATEYLTSVLNGFKLEAEDAVGVVDKLVAIDNAAATSVEEMAVAFQKSAVSAQKAGVDLSTLAAYVGTVSSVTRLSAETVGTAFAL